MSVKEKQDNEEFKVISMDPEVIKGDANKLKLLITSYAAIMEVQDAYMQEEIEAKEEEAKRVEAQIASGKLTESGVESKKEELAALTDQIKGLKEVYEKFSESRTRFMDLAKKALRLPSENFKQLAEKGYTQISDEKIELSSLASSYETAQKTLTDEENVDVFSNINNEDIKKEIERVINEEVYTDDKTGKEKPVKDYNINEVDADKFDEVATKLATDAKKNIDIVKVGRKIFNDALTTADAAKSNDKITAEEAQTDHEDEQGYDEEVDAQANIIPITVSFGDEDAATYEGIWAADSINFDDDKSIESFIEDLKKKNESLKAHGEELSSQISSVKEEQIKAAEKQEQAIKDRDDAKKRSDNARRQIELFNSYKPQMDELRRANEEQAKINSDKEAELQKENETLATINSEITAIETETAAYDEEASQSLEELIRLRAEFAGTKYPGDDDGQYGGAGGRTM